MGFSLIEVIIALAIVSVTMVIFLSLETSLSRTSSQQARLFTAMVAAKNYWYTAHQKEWFNDDAPHEETQNEVRLRYEVKQLSESSSLNDPKRLRVETVTADFREQKYVLHALLYKPEKPEKIVMPQASQKPGGLV